VLYHHSLFAAGIESRLRELDGVKIMKVESADTDVLAQINTIAPDVIILDLLDQALSPQVSILQLLNHSSTQKVIGLDLTRKEVHIYRHEGRCVLNGADLLAAINE
jgi:DNA-binding NarL/FixJ family response regulator